MDLERTRYAKRKKKKINMILNISIAVVLFLIGVLVYQLIFNQDEEVAVDETEVVEEVDEELDDEEMDEVIDEREDVIDEREEVVDRTPVTQEENNEQTDTENEPARQENSGQAGQWEPIGTVQQEPFVAVYEKDHVNWEEMTRALQVATGLGDDMIIWRIENGGDHQSAVGYVSTYEKQNTPYEVRIEWVTNRGWKPVSVNQLSENRFLPNSNEQ